LKADRGLMHRLGGDMDILRELRQTNLVSVMHFDPRAAAVVYESIPGSTLTQLLEGQGPLELAASLVLLEDCISGLEALHNLGVLHRNLTTDAVVVETTGAVLLRDAGLSRTDAAAALVPGHRPFLAPEIVAGAAPTSATDLYAATAVFVESIGGRASKAAIRIDLRPLLSEGMAKDPSKRSATLDNFRRELDDYARATIGESWRRDGRTLLTAAAAAQAARAIRVRAQTESSGEGADAATAAVALLRTPGPRDPRIWVGLGALAFVALLAIVFLARGLSGSHGPITGPLSIFNGIPVFASQSSASPSPSASAVEPAPSAGTLTPGATAPDPIVGPTSLASTPTPPPTPKPNPALASQSITWTSSPPSGETYGGSYLPSATGGGSGNPVLFGSLTPAVCRQDVGNTFGFVGVGTCVIDAAQAGNSRYNAAPSKTMSIDVGQASQTIAITSSPSNPTYLGGYTVTASAAGGAVTFSADSSSVACNVSPSGAVTFTAAGTCVIDANQPGGTDYIAAQPKQQQFDVARASQSIGFTSSAPTCPCTVGQQYTVTATGGGSGNAVTFNIDPSSTIGICTIAGSTVTLTGGLPGTCIIDAFQAGDSNYSAAAEQQQVINVS
jgi:serine/threonine protein kinase